MSFHEGPEGSEVTLTKRFLDHGGSGDVENERFSRVFLAFGPLGTLPIVVRSPSWTARQFELKYQPYFLAPVFGLSSPGGQLENRDHTLSQLFLEVLDLKAEARAVHLQLYTRNHFIEERVKALTSRVPFGQAVAKFLLNRLMAVQGYFHSDLASPIQITASQDSDSRVRLSLKGHISVSTRLALGRLLLRLTRNSRALGMVPIYPLIHFGHPGSGNHIGGTFPISRSPQGNETDLLG